MRFEIGRRWLLSGLGLVAAGLLGAAPALAAPQGEPVRIPFMQSFSGAAAIYGEVMWRGVVLGQEHVNRELGGLRGRPLEMFQADAPIDDMPAAISMFRKLARDQSIPVIFGIGSTGTLAAVHDSVEVFQVPVYAFDSAGHWRLPGFNKWVFRSIPQAKTAVPALMAKVKKKFNIRKAGLLWTNDDEAPVANAMVFRDIAKSHGIEIVEASSKSKEPDWTAQLTRLKAAGVDAMFVSAQAFDAGQLVGQARDMGLDQPVITELAATGPEYWKMSKGKVGTTITWAFYSQDDPRPYVKNLYKGYKAKYDQEPDQWELLTADAVIIMAKIVNSASDLSRAAVRQAFADTAAIESIMGTIGWKGSGDALNDSIVIVRWTDKGTQELVPDSYWK